MATPVKPPITSIGPSETCGTEEVVRQFNNGLYTVTNEEAKEADIHVPRYEDTSLSIDTEEARLLTLHPADNLADHVRCEMKTYSLVGLPSFVAIQNARGYRHMTEAIEINGGALLIPFALERFLRYLRTKIDGPTLLWVRYICVREFDPDEQKTYWTREFSDKMYSLATEAVDMHDINNRLIENDYFESAGHSWKKEWYRSSTELVLPRVCPIRLGTKADIENPTMDYRYMPLDVFANEIRIICIMPAEDPTAPIVAHAAHCPIKCEVTYLALSYRWGTDETPEQIVLNGQRKNIRRNLAEAIRTIRNAEQISPLWIDAISINQDDTAERGRQVRRMGQIYDNASVVYSYIGSPDEDTEDVVAFMKELAKHPMVRSNDKGDFILSDWEATDDNENITRPERLAALCLKLYKLLSRQYFRRSWILQEVAWATNPMLFLARNLGITWDDLDKATNNLQDMLTRDPSLGSQMLDVDPSIEHIHVGMLAYPRKVFYFRYLVSRGQGGGSGFPFFKIEKTSPGFLEVLVLTRNFECTDPRDHIFALWNLAQDKEGLEYAPAYTESYEEVYTSFTKAWILQHGSLDILGSVESTQESSKFYTAAPSWCPNWNDPAIASCLVRRDYLPNRPMAAMHDLSDKLYSADGGMTQDIFDTPLVSFEGTKMHVTGLILDQIFHIVEDAPDIPAGTAPKSHWRAHYWMEAIRTYYRSRGLATYDDPARAVWAMFHGDSVAAWPPVAESGYAPGQCRLREQHVCLPELSRHVRKYADSYSRTEAWSALDTVLRGRRPFFTENGYLGLAPAYLAGESGSWSLAVVAGCSVPLILVEREDGTHRLVGTCFVQGWMDGEWVETMMGAESARELWEAMGEGARIVIT